MLIKDAVNPIFYHKLDSYEYSFMVGFRLVTALSENDH